MLSQPHEVKRFRGSYEALCNKLFVMERKILGMRASREICQFDNLPPHQQLHETQTGVIPLFCFNILKNVKQCVEKRKKKSDTFERAIDTESFN